MSVKDTLQARLKRMRPSEAAVARRLLRSLSLVAEKSLREVAAHCRTSDATVVRACRTAGFDGFQDLKYYVLREFTAGGALPAAQTQDAYREDIAASVTAAEAALEQAARLIRPARAADPQRADGRLRVYAAYGGIGAVGHFAFRGDAVHPPRGAGGAKGRRGQHRPDE
jgi:DNA-binding MurR/RpiR family transcriptional regulator